MELDHRRTDLVQAFNQLTERVPEMTTDELVQYISQLKTVHGSSEELEETLKAEVKKRLTEGGKDGKGNTYFQHSNGTSGIRVEPRVHVTLREDAVERLTEAGYIGEFPMVPDPEKMAEMLNDLHVPEHEYSTPFVTKAELGQLVDEGIIPKDFAQELMDIKVTYAVRVLKQKELTSNG